MLFSYVTSLYTVDFLFIRLISFYLMKLTYYDFHVGNHAVYIKDHFISS